MNEILALAEKRFAQADGGRVGKAVSVVKTGFVPTLAEAAEGEAGEVSLRDVNGDELDAGAGDEAIKVDHTFGAISGFNDDGSFHEAGDRETYEIRGLNGFDEAAPFGFGLENRHER